MSAADVVERLRAAGRDGVELVAEKGSESRVRSSREALRETIQALLDDGFTLFIDLFAVDYPARDERFEVVYQFSRLTRPERVFVHVAAPADDLHVPSVTDLVAGANWPEREAYDLFGVVFDGHPNLTRLLLPDEWEGHPLRKDYPTRGTTPLAPIVTE